MDYTDSEAGFALLPPHLLCHRPPPHLLNLLQKAQIKRTRRVKRRGETKKYHWATLWPWAVWRAPLALGNTSGARQRSPRWATTTRRWLCRGAATAPPPFSNLGPTLKRHETTGVEEAAFLSETTCDMKRPKDPNCLHSAAKHGNLTKCSRGNTTGQATTGNDNRTNNGTCGGVLLGVPALVFDGDQRHTGDTVVTPFHRRRPFAKRLFTESLRPPVAWTMGIVPYIMAPHVMHGAPAFSTQTGDSKYDYIIIYICSIYVIYIYM